MERSVEKRKLHSHLQWEIGFGIGYFSHSFGLLHLSVILFFLLYQPWQGSILRGISSPVSGSLRNRFLCGGISVSTRIAAFRVHLYRLGGIQTVRRHVDFIERRRRHAHWWEPTTHGQTVATLPGTGIWQVGAVLYRKFVVVPVSETFGGLCRPRTGPGNSHFGSQYQ